MSNLRTYLLGLLFCLLFFAKYSYGQRTKLIFIDRIQIQDSSNQVDTLQSVTMSIFKDDTCIFTFASGDSLSYFCFKLDTLEDIRFEFESDTILVYTPYRYLDDSMIFSIFLQPNKNADCLCIDHLIDSNDPTMTLTEVISLKKGIEFTDCFPNPGNGIQVKSASFLLSGSSVLGYPYKEKKTFKRLR